MQSSAKLSRNSGSDGGLHDAEGTQGRRGHEGEHARAGAETVEHAQSVGGYGARVILPAEENGASPTPPRGGTGSVRHGPIRDDPARRKSPARQARTHEQDHHHDRTGCLPHHPQPSRSASPGSRVLRVAAGAALVAGPVLWAAGMWTSPPAAGTTDIDYVTSLGRDGTITQVSALFLHYGNLFIGLGVLAAASLVRGPKGSRLTVIGSLLTALGFTNVSGMLLSDWWNLSAAQNLPIEQAAKVFGGFKDSSLLFLGTASRWSRWSARSCCWSAWPGRCTGLVEPGDLRRPASRA